MMDGQADNQPGTYDIVNVCYLRGGRLGDTRREGNWLFHDMTSYRFDATNGMPEHSLRQEF